MMERVNRYLTGPLSGLSCGLAVFGFAESIVASSGTGASHDLANFGGVALGLVAWAATASHQRRRARRGAPEQPFASIAVGWAAAMLLCLMALWAAVMVVLIAIARGVPLYSSG
jgi:hypothetical protein